MANKITVKNVSIIIIFVGIVVVFLWQMQQQQSNQSLLKEDIKSLQTGLARAQDGLYEQQQELTSQQNQQHQLQNLLMNHDQQWQIKEIEYILRIADINLHYQHNVSMSLHLLQLAKQQLLTLPVGSAAAAQVAVTQLEAQLQKLPVVDINAVLTDLMKMNDEVPQLVWLNSAKDQKPETASTNNQPSQSGWQSVLSQVWKQLEKIIVIRHHDQNYITELNKQDRLYVNQYLQLLLVQARWAILQQNLQLFQSSLQEAQKWLERYYLIDDHTVQAFSAHLQRLQQDYPEVAYPSFIPLIEQIDQLLMPEDKGNELSNEKSL